MDINSFIRAHLYIEPMKKIGALMCRRASLNELPLSGLRAGRPNGCFEGAMLPLVSISGNGSLSPFALPKLPFLFVPE